MPFYRRFVNQSNGVKGQYQNPKLLKSTSIVALMTLLSRIMGFIRDIILAQVFGATAQMDAFLIAFKIPNFFRRLFGEGAFAQAFVPILVEFREKQSQESMQQFVNRIAGTLGLCLLLLVAVAEIVAPGLILVFAPGFWHDPVRHQLAIHMVRITFPYIFLISLTAFAGAVLNTGHRFAIPAFTPVLLNVALIGVAWWWAPHATQPIYVLAYGVLLGGLLQLALQLPALKREGLLPSPRWGWRDPAVQRVLKLMVPALFGVSVAQIGLLIDNCFASFLKVGSISWLYYSDRLTYLPLGVIGVALATVVLPTLAQHYQNASKEKYSATIDWALRIVLIVGLPCCLGLYFLSVPLMATLIQHGQFTSHDVLMSAASLRAFSIGLPGFMLIKILVSAFYSRQNLKTPVKVAAIALVVNVVFNFILVRSMQHAGLALATSLASIVNALLLIGLLLKDRVYKPESGWAGFTLRIILANVIMVWIITFMAGDAAMWLHWDASKRVLHLTGSIVMASISYFLCLFMLGFRFKNFKSPE